MQRVDETNISDLKKEERLLRLVEVIPFNRETLRRKVIRDLKR